MSSMKILGVLLVGAALAGCHENLVFETNNAPVADAWVVGFDQDVEEIAFEFDGSPVSVTLDGSRSTDSDGTVVRYTWLSGTQAPDGGAGRIGPNPDDVAQPTVELTEQGRWIFSLWVEDNQGGVSDPDIVEIVVGEVAEAPCVPDDCMSQVVGSQCCTIEGTGAEMGDPVGRASNKCGVDIGDVAPQLAGVCLQLNQPGEASDECPDIMSTSLEPGCCTEEGFCGSLNTSVNLGCHYARDMPLMPCTPPAP